ncbi:hypothetical protein AAG906_033106 [Vitis piasezkii]
MGILLSSMALHAKQILKLQSLTRSSPSQSERTADFLSCVKEEFGFNCPMDGRIIPCKEDAFNDLTSRLHAF